MQRRAERRRSAGAPTSANVYIYTDSRFLQSDSSIQLFSQHLEVNKLINFWSITAGSLHSCITCFLGQLELQQLIQYSISCRLVGLIASYSHNGLTGLSHFSFQNPDSSFLNLNIFWFLTVNTDTRTSSLKDGSTCPHETRRNNKQDDFTPSGAVVFLDQLKQTPFTNRVI